MDALFQFKENQKQSWEYFAPLETFTNPIPASVCSTWPAAPAWGRSPPPGWAPVVQIVHRVIATFLIKQAGLKRPEAATGAVTLIQHLGSHNTPVVQRIDFLPTHESCNCFNLKSASFSTYVARFGDLHFELPVQECQKRLPENWEHGLSAS